MKHTFLYFQCIGNLYYLLYKYTTATFYTYIHILIHYTKYNYICGILSHNLSLRFPIKVYYEIILIMDSHRFRTQKELFIHFCKLATLYLNRKDILRNKTNHGIILFWYYIGETILLTIHVRRCG